MKATIFDYGAGNLHSLGKALEWAGATVAIEPDPARAIVTDLLVLPGVGAFSAAAERVAPAREAMREAIDRGLPCLGICLGMQLLFRDSEEGPGAGLDVIPGRVSRLRARRVPQIGWNSIEGASDPLFAAAPIGVAYFANGYACRPDDVASVVAWATHENDRFPAAIRRGRLFGVQFHPEKSSRPGLRLLAGFVREVASAMRDTNQSGAPGSGSASGAPRGPRSAGGRAS
jgi:imidazole glycerol-phosphate synthase subunit HisH